MNPLQTLLNWLAPLLNPLEEFHTHVSRLASIHQDSVHTFDTLASGLMAAPAGTPEAFTGELATSFWQDVQAYLNAENALMSTSTGTVTTLTGEGGIDAATAACQDCVSEITTDATTVATEIGDDAALDEATSLVDVAAVAEGGANPIADVAGIILTLIAGAALLASLIKLGWDIYNAIQTWQRSMYRIGDTPLPQLPPNPTPVTAPEPSPTAPRNSTSLTPAQQRLLNDVKSRLGTATYNDAEIEALIRAGYLNPDAIAAILKGGGNVSAVFSNPGDAANIATMMNELTPAQQQQFIKIVELYLKTHPGLTSHQVYNYLRYTKMKAQAEQLKNEIQASSIAHRYPTATARLLNDRLLQYALNPMLAVTDPFTVTDGQLGVNGGGWYANVTGVWAEWSRVKYYDRIGQLQDFSVPFTPSTGRPGETDIILKNGTWVEVKNVPNMDYGTSSWKVLKQEVTKYMNGGARHVLVELPMGLPPSNRTRMEQQLEAMGRARGITVDVQYPGGVSFDPPAVNWGNSLPTVSP